MFRYFSAGLPRPLTCPHINEAKFLVRICLPIEQPRAFPEAHPKRTHECTGRDHVQYAEADPHFRECKNNDSDERANKYRPGPLCQ